MTPGGAVSVGAKNLSPLQGNHPAQPFHQAFRDEFVGWFPVHPRPAAKDPVGLIQVRMTRVAGPADGGGLSGVNFALPPAPLQDEAARVKAPAVQVRNFRLSILSSGVEFPADARYHPGPWAVPLSSLGRSNHRWSTPVPLSPRCPSASPGEPTHKMEPVHRRRDQPSRRDCADQRTKKLP